MNISGLIKSVIGETQAGEPKSLELKVGEVVKGLVLQLITETDALINIGGVQVRARLETPLKQGQVTLLQVQPESSTGQITLKPLDTSAVLIADESFGEVFKTVGLPDSAANREMVQTLHQSGIALSKENVQAFAQVQSQMPATLAQEDWVPSAVVAFQKGIPLTADTVGALKQAISGPGFHATLQQLDSEMNKLLTANQHLSATTRAAVHTVKQVISLVREVSSQVLAQAELTPDAAAGGTDGYGGRNIATGGTGSTAASGVSSGIAGNGAASGLTAAAGSGAANGTVASGTAGASGSGAVNGTVASGTAGASGSGAANGTLPSGTADATGTNGNAAPAGNAGRPTGAAAGAAVPVPGQAAAAGSPANPAAVQQGSQSVEAAPTGGLGQMNPAAMQQGSTSSQAAATGSLGQTTPGTAQGSQMDPAAPPPAQGAGPSFAEPARSAAAQPQAAAPSTGVAPLRGAAEEAAAPSAGSLQDADAGGHWISRLMKAMGVEHEHDIGKLADKMTSDAPLRTDNGIAGPRGEAQAVQTSPEDRLNTSETLKSALLQLVQSDEVPAALKETAQQAVQQITGQQLLLNNDRSSMFSHITMFVPLMNANGVQTAAIHIQSRKGPRGQIDAQNCRLVFDLRMKTLGDTMVDVQVVDRIVSLRVLNDQPFIQQLLESYREEIAAGLAGVGYQFISLKCSPYPESGEAQAASAESTGTQSNTLASHLQSAYGKKAYRGMDVRV